VRDRLRDLGYATEPVQEADLQAPTAWYTPDDLSREEAQVLAARMIPEFVRDHPVDPAVADALRQRVEASLFADFTAVRTDPGAPKAPARTGRAAAIVAATTDVVGSDSAQSLGRFVDSWLDRR
jgi:hypothetical protein